MKGSRAAVIIHLDKLFEQVCPYICFKCNVFVIAYFRIVAQYGIQHIVVRDPDGILQFGRI